MRMLIFAALVPIMAGPAFAQACEASRTGKAGEVIAVRTGDGGRARISWAVEQAEGVGEESRHFSRPGLLLDFDVANVGAAMVPSGSIVTVSRISSSEIGRPPALTEVRVRATPGDGAPVEWRADTPARGEAMLAKRLREAWPDELRVELLMAGDRVVASSTFDLSMRADAEALAREAAAEAARKCG